MALLDRPAVGPSATVLARSALPPEVLLPRVAAVPLPLVFTGWGPFPRVLAVDGQEGDWDSVGKRRTIRLADGGAVVETFVEHDPGRSFAYELTGFTDVFRHLVRGVRGEWSVAPDAGGAVLRWTWEFAPRAGRGLLMAAVVGPLWRRYMARMVRETVLVAEAA